MKSYDVLKIKEQFPALNRLVWDKPLIYLDSAASMQKPSWVLLKDIAEWRWLLNTNKSLWYKKVLIFRCEKKDDWSRPKYQIESLLNKYK